MLSKSPTALGSPQPGERAGHSHLASSLAAGAALAATALLVRRSAQRAEKRHSPAGRFVQVDGVRLHYLERGQGRPVVLLHGNGVMATDFSGSGLLDALAERYRVIAFDRPGFGYSQRPWSRVCTPGVQAGWLGDALALLNIDRPVVVGHSWGTLVALALAISQPHRLHGLLLVSGYYYPTPQLDAVWQSPPAIPLLGDVMRYTVSPLLARLITPIMVRKMFAPQPVPDAFWNHVPLELMLRPWQLRAAAGDAALMVPAAAALSRHYGEIDLPVTIVAGSEDRVANPSRQSARLHRDLPRSTLLVMRGTGHMPHYAAPERLASAVDDLFDRAPLQQPPLQQSKQTAAPVLV